MFHPDEPCDFAVTDMATGRRNRESAGPAMLGSTHAAVLRLIVWCKACRHQVETDIAELVERYGADLPPPNGASALSARPAVAASSISW